MGHAADRQQAVLIAHPSKPTVLVGERGLPQIGVQLFHRALEEAHPFQHAPDRIDRVSRLHQRGGDFGE